MTGLVSFGTAKSLLVLKSTGRDRPLIAPGLLFSFSNVGAISCTLEMVVERKNNMIQSCWEEEFGEVETSRGKRRDRFAYPTGK